MIDAKHVHKLLECKYDFKHWIKDVISSFNFKDGIDYISYRYDNNGEQIIDNNSHVFRHDYYLFPKSILCIFPNTRPDAILTYRVFILIHIVLF